MRFYHILLLSALLSIIHCSTLTLIAHYPSSSPMYIRGNLFGLDWNEGTKMAFSENGVFEILFNIAEKDIGKLFEFKVLINDDHWMIGSNALVVVPGESLIVNVYPHFYSMQGRYEYVRNVYSKQLDNVRDLVVYVPPSYDENKFKYYKNVLIMHDGENLFNSSTSFGGNSWKCQDTVNYLVGTGDMEEIIIVGVDNTNDRIAEYTYSVDPEYGGGKGDLYLDFLQDTVIPLVRKTFRVDPSVEKYGILGSSLGGLISCYAGWTRSALYDTVGCMSSSFWWNNQDFNNTILSDDKKPSDITFYIDSGNSGPSQDGMSETITVVQTMRSLGFTLHKNLHYYLDKGGSHNEISWRNRFHIPMELLYPPHPINQPN